MLYSENTFLKSDGVFIIGHLTIADSENKIEKVFDKLYKLLDDESMIPQPTQLEYLRSLPRQNQNCSPRSPVGC